eukprot:PhM_4_TR12053/c0_g1_i1/m.5135
MFSDRFVFFLILLLLAVSASFAVESTDALKKLIVIHRHGARQPAYVGPQGNIHYGIAELTPVGAQMMHNLGVHLRGSYGTFLPDSYNVTQISSRSSFVNRTLQSGMAMLKGMFPQAIDAPIITYMPLYEDSLIDPFGAPTYQLHNIAPLVKTHVANFTRSVLTSDEITMMSGAVGMSPSNCFEDLAACVMLVQDVAASGFSNGNCPARICSDAVLLMKLEKIAAYSNYIEGIDLPGANSDDFKERAYRGSLGAWLALDMARAVEDAGHTPVLLRHYSAHDSTLTVLLHALGLVHNASSDYNVPVFGSTLILEVTSTSMIRASWGAPEQAHNSNYSYTFSPLNIPCDADPSTPPSPMCDAATWVSAVKQRYGGPDRCYAYAADFAATGCDHYTSPTSNALCYYFRQHCPVASCGGSGSNMLQNTSDVGLPCVKTR